MARPEMESRVDDRTSVAPNSCRMEALRDVWSSGSIVQSCQRHRAPATLPSTVSPPLPHNSTTGAFSSDNVQQQDNLLRDNTGREQEVSSATERPLLLPDLLEQDQSSSEDLTSSSSSNNEDEPQLEEQVVLRLGIQLRTIGDQMNSILLQRNAVPHWQNWRGLYRGLLAFVADTLNTFYQHGLR